MYKTRISLVISKTIEHEDLTFTHAKRVASQVSKDYEALLDLGFDIDEIRKPEIVDRPTQEH